MNVRDLLTLEKRVAIITGGSRGIGYMIAEGFAESGANLVICARKPEPCEEAAARLRDKGVSCHALRCDISQQEQVKELIDFTMREFGRIDVLVNNAGTAWGAALEDTPLERWDQMFDLNVRGSFFCTTEAGRHMIAAGSGTGINIVSVSGFKAMDPEITVTPGYGATKGAMIALTRNLARYWAQHNITVNAIAPGIFPSELARPLLEKRGDLMTGKVPLGRLGSVDDLKGVAVFLASPAAAYMTGQVLVVDGGFTS